MTSKLPLAVVGCGYWGSKHIRVVHQMPSLEVALAVDPREARRAYIQSQCEEVPVAPDFEAVLKSDAAGVIIATPLASHLLLAKAALLAGKHVLIEKPMATTAAECRELIKIAEAKQLVVMVGHTFEYHPALQLTRDLIREGSIGQIYYASSRRLNLGLYRADANVLWDLAPHDLSMLFSVLGTELHSVSAWGCKHVLPNTEDVVYALIGMDNGVTAHLHVSWLDPVKVRQFTVVGGEGMLVFDDVLQSEKVRIYDKRFKPPSGGDAFADFPSAYRHGDAFIPQLPAGEPLQIEITDFVKSILTGAKPKADGYSGLRVVQALERTSIALQQARINERAGMSDFIPQVPHSQNQTMSLS